MENYNLLRWQCRRGMLELDLILSNFLDQHYNDSSLEIKKLFQALLGCQDQELFAWLIHKSDTFPPKYQEIIALIRQCCKLGA